jgi:hypothetical protein
MSALMHLFEGGGNSSRQRAQRHLDGGGSAFGDADIDEAMARKNIDMGVGVVAAGDECRVERGCLRIETAIETIDDARARTIEKMHGTPADRRCDLRHAICGVKPRSPRVSITRSQVPDKPLSAVAGIKLRPSCKKDASRGA